MKILRIIPSMDPQHGGPCQGIRNSISELKKLGAENEVLCFDSPHAAYLGNDDFVIHTIGPSVGPYTYCSALHTWLDKNIARFDVLIIHGLWLYNSYGTYSFWKKYKTRNTIYPKLYVMPHGMLDPYFQRAKDRRLKAIRNWFFWKLIEGRVVNNADGILFTCQQELLLAKKTFSPYHPRKELNIGYGILPPPLFKEQMKQAFQDKCPTWDGRSFILFLSRIHQKKGVDLLISAYLSLKKQQQNLPPLVVAGPGLDTPYGQRIQAMAEGENDILFPGMLTGDAKWGAFYNSEAFILPSHQENFGIAIVEAMASGKPVLISDQVNIWREIEQNKAGLVEQDTLEGTVSLLKKWLALNSEQKKEIGLNARKTYEQYFSVEEAAKMMIKTLQNA